MKFRFLPLLLALLPLALNAQSVPNGPITFGEVWTQAQWNAAWQAKVDFPLVAQTAAEVSAGVTPTNYSYPQGNVLRYGADPTGTADSAAAGNACISVAALSGGVCLWNPGTYIASTALNLASNVTLTGYGATITAQAGNTSNPVLISVSAKSNVSIKGLTLDGGGAAFANTNAVVTVFNSSKVDFDFVTLQNTAGIAILLSSSVDSGVRNSTFSNIGMHWQSSLSTTDRHQAIAFCCTTPTQPQKNYAINNYFVNIGLDAVSFTGQLDFVADTNRCKLAVSPPQYVTLSSATDWPACVFAQGDTSAVISNNVSDSAPGNGIDIASGSSNIVITGNSITGSGGGGMSLAGISDFAVSGNVANNNGNNSISCTRDGVDFLDAVSTGSVSGNTFTDTRAGGSKTQQNGVFAITGCTHPSTLTNVFVDMNNATAGNAVAAYGGNISGPSWSQGLSPTNTGNWTFTPASGTPITINVSGTPGILINEATAANAIVVAAPAAVSAQIILRGNNATGATGLLITQDASGVAQIEQNTNSAMNLWTNGVSRYTISAAGGLFAAGVTGGDKGLGTVNASLFNNGAALAPSATTDTTNGTNISSGTVAAARLPAVAVPLSGTTGSIGGGALTAGACTSGTVAVTSSTTAMAVSVSPVADPGTSITWQGFVSAAGTVTVRVCALVAATPTATAYSVRVLQ